jgi:heme-degrading monooxygenase HmoA
MPPTLTVFRNRLVDDPEALDEYHRWADEMAALADAQPGFIARKVFVAEDGERVSLVEFDSEETAEAWARHPRHREAQALGRERFYESFRVLTVDASRERRFDRE